MLGVLPLPACLSWNAITDMVVRTALEGLSDPVHETHVLIDGLSLSDGVFYVTLLEPSMVSRRPTFGGCMYQFSPAGQGRQSFWGACYLVYL